MNTAKNRPRPWLFLDIASSRNPIVIHDGVSSHDTEELSWTDFSTALLMWLLLSTGGKIRAISLPFVFHSEAIRRKVVYAPKPHLTFPEALLAMHSYPGGMASQPDNVTAVYALVRDVQRDEDLPRPDYSLSADEVRIRTSLHLNRCSKQLLSLSFFDGPRPGLPSWSLNWAARTTRLLLNHPACNFSASSHSTSEASFARVMDQLNGGSGVRKALSLRGFVIDSIRRSSDYLPPRRHCDHYDIGGGNSYFFSEWYDFAQGYARGKTEEDVLLAYADTIQARGCGHVWENLESTPQERLNEARKFIRVFEHEEAVKCHTARLFYAACFASHDRKFAITKKWRFCLVPNATQDKDLICIPHGSRVP